MPDFDLVIIGRGAAGFALRTVAAEPPGDSLA